MDIKSGCGYPASSLSNFSPHPFELDGVQIASMEGFLQTRLLYKIKNESHLLLLCLFRY